MGAWDNISLDCARFGFLGIPPELTDIASTTGLIQGAMAMSDALDQYVNVCLRLRTRYNISIC